MSTTLYVLDTSYLIEIAGCGRDSNPKASDEVRKRFKQANAKGGRFFVPLPCLFELGDHIADVKHKGRRRELADWLLQTVQQCLDNSEPWMITPTQNPEDVLPPLMQRFVPLASERSVGLVDAFTAEEALRLKVQFKDKGIKGKVHIWTNDRDLKSLEPDNETNPYLWRSDGTAR